MERHKILIHKKGRGYSFPPKVVRRIKGCEICGRTLIWNGNLTGRLLKVHEAGRECEICPGRVKDGKNSEYHKELEHDDDFKDGHGKVRS